MLSRRQFIQSAPPALAVGATIAAPVVVEAAQPMTPQEKYDHHLAGLKEAAQEIDPRICDWRTTRPDDDDGVCALVITAFRKTGEYQGDGIYEGPESVFGRFTKYTVKLRPDRKDGQRAFDVSCSMDRMVMSESRLNTFIGRRVA